MLELDKAETDLKPGDLIRVAAFNAPVSCASAAHAGLPDGSIGIFVSVNDSCGWLQHPVCDVYINGEIAAYSKHLVKKL
jgi:hypothetical protein